MSDLDVMRAKSRRKVILADGITNQKSIMTLGEVFCGAGFSYVCGIQHNEVFDVAKTHALWRFTNALQAQGANNPYCLCEMIRSPVNPRRLLHALFRVDISSASDADNLSSPWIQHRISNSSRSWEGS